MMRYLFCLVGIVGLLATAQAARSFQDLYADVVWENLTGLSSFQNYRLGWRDGAWEYYGFIKNEWANTHGTALPQDESRGLTPGVGIRYWCPGHKMFLTTSYGECVLGSNVGREDFRVGAAGYDAWTHQRRFTDLYGELFWVQYAQDAFLNLRLRPGLILRQRKNEQLWVYGVGQLWASGTGDNGTENRAEIGVGVGCIAWNRVSANFDFRVGDAFSGTIPHRHYINPMFVIATNL